MISGVCGGCQFEKFPYKARCIVNTGSYNEIEFKDINDVWDYIMLLEKEAVEFHKNRGTNGAVITDIFHQLPFFCCTNKILKDQDQRDISRFLYCVETGVKPYSDTFGQTPRKWIEKFWLIKTATTLRDGIMSQELRKKNN